MQEDPRSFLGYAAANACAEALGEAWRGRRSCNATSRIPQYACRK